ncbi:MAG: response regulator [Proteobacteria bacterium]|nr:response regulator [Pseudomonadota bacterium]
MAKILVVDDEFGVGELLREVLDEEGHAVRLAINGRQGLEQMAVERPDVVILDFMMPVLNGGDVLKAMREDPKLADIPVIVTSSLPEATVAERAPGYTAFVRKPYQIGTIVARVAAALDTGPRESGPRGAD